MTVGQLSELTGVPVRTLREYTDLGLIHTLGRSPANYRLFDAEALRCVRWIGRMRGLGLTVAEIRELTSRPTGNRLAELLRRSRGRLERRISEQRRTLRRIAQYEADQCPDLEGDRAICCSGVPGAGEVRP